MSRPRTLNQSAAALWASAFVILALIIVQAGRLPANPAHAATTAARSDFVLLTTSSGRGGDANPDELLFVIDNRTQAMLAYEIEDTTRTRIDLRDGGSLDALFRRARP